MVFVFIIFLLLLVVCHAGFGWWVFGCSLLIITIHSAWGSTLQKFYTRPMGLISGGTSGSVRLLDWTLFDFSLQPYTPVIVRRRNEQIKHHQDFAQTLGLQYHCETKASTAEHCIISVDIQLLRHMVTMLFMLTAWPQGAVPGNLHIITNALFYIYLQLQYCLVEVLGHHV